MTEPIEFEYVPEGPPSRGGRGGPPNPAKFQPVIDACMSKPGEWFRIHANSRNHAYGIATALRTRYKLDAKARDGDVWVRYDPDAETPVDDFTEPASA